MDQPLQEFLSSLERVTADGLRAKELELARMRNRLRNADARERKQRQRIKEMVAKLKATREDKRHLMSEILRIQTEMATVSEVSD
jgi:hypothetical protein